VHTASMQEALRKVYGAGALADEIGKASAESPHAAQSKHPAGAGFLNWIRKHLP